MLKVVSDVLTATDREQITLLGMFDLSAAFDTVDHAILLKRLDVSFGIRGNALIGLRLTCLGISSSSNLFNDASAPYGLYSVRN